VSPVFVEEARSNGYQIITIPSTVREKLSGQTDISGNIIQDLSQFVSEWNDGFKFNFIPPEEMNSSEQAVFYMTNMIAELVGGIPQKVE
jgi:hypothetical protein